MTFHVSSCCCCCLLRSTQFQNGLGILWVEWSHMQMNRPELWASSQALCDLFLFQAGLQKARSYNMCWARWTFAGLARIPENHQAENSESPRRPETMQRLSGKSDKKQNNQRGIEFCELGDGSWRNAEHTQFLWYVFVVLAFIGWQQKKLVTRLSQSLDSLQAALNKNITGLVKRTNERT